jgi:hypothetical protein
MRGKFFHKYGSWLCLDFSLIKSIQFTNYILFPNARLQSSRYHAFSVERDDFLEVENDQLRYIFNFRDFNIVYAKRHIPASK